MTGTSLGALKEPGAWKSEATGHAFYLATRGAALVLYLEDTIGSSRPEWKRISLCSISSRRR